jgi:hypothetical protein
LHQTLNFSFLFCSEGRIKAAEKERKAKERKAKRDRIAKQKKKEGEEEAREAAEDGEDGVYDDDDDQIDPRFSFLRDGEQMDFTE